MKMVILGLSILLIIPGALQAAKLKVLLSDQQGFPLAGVEALLTAVPVGGLLLAPLPKNTVNLRNRGK